MSSGPRPAQLFYVYSRRDKALRAELGVHLSALERQGLIAPCAELAVLPGDEWEQKLSESLEAADILLLLVSAHFLASDSCWNVAVNRALTQRDGRRVIPILLSPVDWIGAPFANLKALPEDGRPISTFSDRDKAWVEVAAAIRTVVQVMQQQPGWERCAATADPAEPRASFQPRALRKFVEAMLANETDFMNFCRDYFDEAYRRIGGNMDRARQLIELLEVVRRDGEEQRLLDSLRSEFPKAYLRNRGLLDLPG